MDLLFSLFTSPYMATSLRLLIVKTFDELTQTAPGICWFMGEMTGEYAGTMSAYQRLIDITLTKQVRHSNTYTCELVPIHTISKG